MEPMVLNLEKVLEEGSLRWIGERYDGLNPHDLVIAGMSITSIAESIGFKTYKIGRFKIEYAFAAIGDEQIIYIYVNPHFKNYRAVFRKIVGQIPDGYDIDHVLAKNLAKYFNYKYVLLCMVPSSINRRHGGYERKKIPKEELPNVPEICFLDNRIFDKVLFRNPKARQTLDFLLKRYDPESLPDYGLTLKQKGIWNTSFGFHLIDKDLIDKIMTPIQVNCFSP